MMDGETGKFKSLFPRNRIPGILKSIILAGETLAKKRDRDREDWITRRLHQRLICSHPFRNGPLTIQLQPEIPSSEKEADAPGGRIDLLVPTEYGYQIYFALEAKRLRFHSPNGRFKTGNDEYIKNGMMRFITGRYSPYMENGGMIGYVFDGDIANARSGVGKRIESEAERLKLMPPMCLAASQVLPDNHVDETRHDLKTRCFTIYHLFISV